MPRERADCLQRSKGFCGDERFAVVAGGMPIAGPVSSPWAALDVFGGWSVAGVDEETGPERFVERAWEWGSASGAGALSGRHRDGITEKQDVYWFDEDDVHGW
jgi:hypothetical protein